MRLEKRSIARSPGLDSSAAAAPAKGKEEEEEEAEVVVVRSGPDAADAGFRSEQAAAGEHTARRLRAGHGVEHTRAAPAAQRSAWPAGLVRGKRSCCVARLFPFLPLTRLLRLWPTCVAMHPRRASVRRLRVCHHGSVMCPARHGAQRAAEGAPSRDPIAAQHRQGTTTVQGRARRSKCAPTAQPVAAQDCSRSTVFVCMA